MKKQPNESSIPNQQCETEQQKTNCAFTEISCPVCGFEFCLKIKKLPAEYTCPNCKSSFCIIAKVSEKIQK